MINLKKSSFILFLSFIVLIKAQDKDIVQIDIKSGGIKLDSIQESPIEVLIGVLPNLEAQIEDFSNGIKKCLERTTQIKTIFRKLNKPKDKKTVKSLFTEGFDWVIFIGKSEDENYIEIRIYDPIEAIMIVGKKVKVNNYSNKFLSYKISDIIWNELLDEPSCFCSKIAFIKRKKDAMGKNYSEVWTSDFDGSNAKKFINDSKIYAGLGWYNNSNTPCLLGSEITKFNMKLVCFNSNKLKKTLLDTSGTCIGVSLSSNNKQAIYCRSGDIWHYECNPKTKKYIHKKIISNDGKNTTPTLLENGDIIFCSNSKDLYTKDAVNKKESFNKGPKIYYYNAKDRSIELITPEGYCESPTYSEVNNQIAYSKRVKGDMQLFVYDINSKKHKQVTFDSGSKVDCVWSPCGSYIMFCNKTDTSNRLSVIHVKLKKQWNITAANEECVYPTWSVNFLNEIF